MIYLPELPFDIAEFGRRVRELLEKKPSVVVAVSEGIRTADGKYVCELGNSVDFVDAFGHKQLSGTASYLASYIAGEIGCKTRARCVKHFAEICVPLFIQSRVFWKLIK